MQSETFREEKKQQILQPCGCSNQKTDQEGSQIAYIGSFNAAPHFMKVNANIHSGYRINFNSTSKLLRSLFILHNQSVNIWSHLIAFLAFACITIIFITVETSSFNSTANQYQQSCTDLQNSSAVLAVSSALKYELCEAAEQQSQNISRGILVSYNQTIKILNQNSSSSMSLLPITLQNAEYLPIQNPISRMPLHIYLLTAILCLLFSTIFHWFYPHSKKTYGILLRFDFAGISLLIAGTAFPPFYYGMYCTSAASIYLTLIVAAAIVCFIIGLFEFIHKHENIIYRSIIFGSFGSSLLIPLFHLAVNEHFFDNYGDPFQFSSSYPQYLSGILCYAFGFYIYTTRCPERHRPGKFDICGHSHQIWHIMTVFGMIATYFGALENYEMRKMSICPDFIL